MKAIFFALLSCFASHSLANTQSVEGVSIVNLIANPKDFEHKPIQTNGYVLIHGEGPTQGYWLSLFMEFDPYSSIKIDVPEDSPLRKWVQDGKFYTISGIFKNCDSLSCRPTIIFDKERPYMIR